MAREYNYRMGFRINGTQIPDPSSFTGAESDLDTLGSRDANGNLRRNKVATKYHTQLEWANIEWSMARTIGNLMNKGDRFNFTYIDPIAGEQTIVAYCGDRDWETVNAIKDDPDDWILQLKVSVIEI